MPDAPNIREVFLGVGEGTFVARCKHDTVVGDAQAVELRQYPLMGVFREGLGVNPELWAILCYGQSFRQGLDRLSRDTSFSTCNSLLLDFLERLVP